MCAVHHRRRAGRRTGAEEVHNRYHGELEVTGDAEGSQVAVRLTTEHDDGPAIQQGLDETVANVKRLVEAR